MRLLVNLWQVACPNISHGYDATAYLLDTGEELWLIDCGTPEGYEQIVDNIRKTGHEPQNVRKIFGTHGHYDHVGAASLFARDFGTALYLHGADRDQVERGDDIRTTAGILYGAHFPRTKVFGEVSDGQRFDFPTGSLGVLHTPGHTPGGVCYVVTVGGLTTLVAGDTLWGGFRAEIGSDEAAWRRSLAMLCSRHFDFMTFGHTGPVLYGDADARLKEAQSQFGVYYNPWFKAMSQTYHY